MKYSMVIYILLFILLASAKKCFSSLEMQRAFWDDVLLIISYHHPHYESIPFFEKLYGKYFPNIVFYGLKSEHLKVELISDSRGWLVSYLSLIHALQKYPHYKGYLWVQDDCVINFWNFYRFDKKKIWHNNYGVADFTKGESAVQGWGWWKSRWGYKPAKALHNQLAEKYSEVLQYNCGKNAACWGYSDIVFIPAKFREDAIQLFSMCEEQGIMLEIALPTVCACLSKKEDSELFYGVALWGSEQKKVLDRYSVELDFIHPIKFSSERNRKFIEKKFNEVLNTLNNS